MSLAEDDSKQQYKKIHVFSGHFYDHAGAAMQYGEHLPMEEVYGYTGSNWALPLDKHLHRIAPAATMVFDFGSKKLSCGIVKSLFHS